MCDRLTFVEIYFGITGIRRVAVLRIVVGRHLPNDDSNGNGAVKKKKKTTARKRKTRKEYVFHSFIGPAFPLCNINTLYNSAPEL